MSILKVNNLKYRYKNTQALNGISFQAGNGLTGILGPNGAGKTTAMKLITTLFSIQDGDIYLNDFNYKKDLSDIRKRIGYLPQDFSVYGNLEGREFLQIIASIKLECNRKKISQHIDEIIDKLEMKEYIGRKIKEYSGGMRQKLGFAQVLIGDPELIVVDEPTAGLDPEQRNIIRELFSVISKERIVLVTTHIVEDIEDYCSSILLIKGGNLIFNGSKAEFMKEAEEKIWEDKLSPEEYKYMAKNCQIISTKNMGGYIQIKYISNKPLTKKSIKPILNLQDAYIIHSKMKGRKNNA